MRLSILEQHSGKLNYKMKDTRIELLWTELRKLRNIMHTGMIN